LSVVTKLADTVRQLLAPWRAGQKARGSADEEAPLRAELYSADQMAQHGKALAAAHRLATGAAPDLLLARLAANRSGPWPAIAV
jgi:hypothetical protein